MTRKEARNLVDTVAKLAKLKAKFSEESYEKILKEELIQVFVEITDLSKILKEE